MRSHSDFIKHNFCHNPKIYSLKMTKFQWWSEYMSSLTVLQRHSWQIFNTITQERRGDNYYYSTSRSQGISHPASQSVPFFSLHMTWRPECENGGTNTWSPIVLAQIVRKVIILLCSGIEIKRQLRMRQHFWKCCRKSRPLQCCRILLLIASAKLILIVLLFFFIIFIYNRFQCI